MKKKTLVITKSTKDVLHHVSANEVFYSYNFKQGILSTKEVVNLNNAKLLSDLALSEKEDYAAFIYSKNQLFLDQKLTFNNNLSLYFLSLFSNKRTEFFDTYAYYLHLIILKNILKETPFHLITCIGFSAKEVAQLSLNLGQTVEAIGKFQRPSNYNTAGLRNLLFYLTTIIYLALMKLFLKKNKTTQDKLFISQFPHHFNKDFRENKYVGLINEKESSLLLTIISDGFHQNLKPVQFIKALLYLRQKQKTENLYLLDLYVSFGDVFRALIIYLKHKKKYQRLKESPFDFKGIRLDDQLKEELQLSSYQIPRLLMYFNAYFNLFKEVSPKEVVYHLHEFCSGRFVSYVLNNYFPKILSSGFQHGPISKRKMLYALAKGEVNSMGSNLTYVPLPKQNYCEDAFSVLRYSEYGYPNLKQLDRVGRLDYLDQIERNAIQKNTCLVACGLHDAKIIVDHVLRHQLFNEKKLFIKFHPKTKNIQLIKKIKQLNNSNIQVITAPISEYLAFVEEVLVTYSSVGLEAQKLGIKTTVLVFDYVINESPLLDSEHQQNDLLEYLFIT